MGKRSKVNKKKFVSRIIVVLAILAIILLAVNIISKGEENDTKVLIMDKQDITDSLVSDIYIDSDKNLYLSIQDITNIFDSNLYYEEETGKVITTSGTKVGAIDVNNNTLELNTATLSLSPGVIKYDTGYYIPVSEITNIYNIEISTTENSAVISSLYKELITVKTTKKVSLKENTSSFSGTMQKLEAGAEVIFIEDVDDSDWIKVLTYEGNIGYIKEKNVSEKETKRGNMEESDFSSKTVDAENAIEVNKSTINNENMKDFASRKNTVASIISNVISKEKYTVNLNLNGVEVEEKLLERFVIELAPRLKEIGGNIIVSNNSILSNDFLSENKI